MLVLGNFKKPYAWLSYPQIKLSLIKFCKLNVIEGYYKVTLSL